MLIALSRISPSPFNPKKPLTKKQAAALRKNVEAFGFQRSLCVCRDFYGGGDGFICLDGNTALTLLNELGKVEIDCYIVEKVTDDKSLKKFMAGYSINKEPLYSEFALELGEIDFADFTGLSFDKYTFDTRIDDIDADMDALSGGMEEEEDAPSARTAGPAPGPARSRQSAPAQGQAQYFLTLPYDCVEKLKGFVKTKAFKANKTGAVAAKIDGMNDRQFLENLLQIIL